MNSISVTQPDARQLAFNVLLEVECSQAHADGSLAEGLATSGLDERDRRLATLLVYGTLARQLTLDHSLDEYGNKPPASLDPEVRVALRLGLFQLAFLDRVPAWAAVDSAVALTKRCLPRASAYVNAVLRKAADKGLATPTGDRLERVAIEMSHPRWLVEMWSQELGSEEAERLMETNNGEAPTVLRALGERTHCIDSLCAEGRQARAGRWAPDAILCPGPPPQRPGLVAQGEASQLAVLLCGVRPGERILDASAAPGGKTAYLATLAGPTGKVVAVDPRKGAGEQILARVAMEGPADGRASVLPFEGPIEDFVSEQPFDLVLVDAPCSGLGTLRQHPEIKWRLSPTNIRRMAEKQASILAAATDHLRPGGRLVYATCTLSRAENEGIVEGLLAARDDIEETSGGPGGPGLASELFDDAGRFKSFPHRHGTDGFFVARFTRKA